MKASRSVSLSGLLALAVLASAVSPAVVFAQTATDGDFSISYQYQPEFFDPETEEFFPVGGELDSWISDNGSFFRSHLFQQSLYFRTDQPGVYDDREYPIETLTLNSVNNINPATNLVESDKIFLSLGDPLVDPLGIDLVYDLDETAPGGLGSTIRESIRLTSFSAGAIGVSLFAYTDLDIDNSPGGDTAQLFSANTIRQTSFVGSTVDVRVSSGPNPNSFDIRSYSNLLDAMEDDTTEELLNNNSFGPGDATHAFQWNLTLGATPIEIGIQKVGTFASFVLPDSEDGGFFFDDFAPPTAGESPRWYDPTVAVGYNYEVTAGDNAFAELYLPDGFVDGEYVLEILDPEHDHFGEMIVLSVVRGAMTYSFVGNDAQGDGVRSFRITGIEPEAFIDPADAQGFPTGLTFVSADAVSFSQIAIAIPEPTTLFIAALAMAASLRRRLD